jgi:20S proteasome alpha/beta subunit
MTIIAGLICSEGLVLAADSQAGSFRGVHVKRLDYTKIYDFRFDGATVIVTGAGETPFIARAKEIIEAKASDAKIKSSREVADIAEDAMKTITKRYVIDRMRDLGPSSKAPILQSDELPFAPPNFELLLGVWCGAEWCLYTVYPDGVAGREEGYASMGSGSAFAEYLLARLYRDDLTLEEAIRVAVYVIEEVKKVDLHCGGPTHVVGVTKDGVVRKRDDEIREIVLYLDEQDQSLKDSWRIIAKGPRAPRVEAVRAVPVESGRVGQELSAKN